MIFLFLSLKSNLCFLYHSVADPDPDRHFDADPDLTFNFDADPNKG